MTTLFPCTGYSCSCSPFECVCGSITPVYPGRQSSYQMVSQQQHHHESLTVQSNHHQYHQVNTSPNNNNNGYHQMMTGNEAPTYSWPQEAAAMEQSSLGYLCGTADLVPQEVSAYPTVDGFAGDLFQPEEIFQLDQPIRPDFAPNNNNNNNNNNHNHNNGGGGGEVSSRSPSSLLDLSSGTIKYEVPDMHEQTYWTQLLSEDSSSSHVSAAPNHDCDRGDCVVGPLHAQQSYDSANYLQAQASWPTSAQQPRPPTQQHEPHGYASQFDSSQSSQSPVPEATPPFIGYEGYHHHHSSQMIQPQSPRQAYQQQLKNPEVCFYQPEDRCHQYSCGDLLDNRLTQSASGMGYAQVTDLDLPPFIDYTLVGMLCNSGEEHQSFQHQQQSQQPQQQQQSSQQTAHNSPSIIQPPCQGYASHH
ncbi:putative uncharacterized protein DDB_G0271606 [Copidosoma floridanum]|uniref:putative uncharacterized protein DDB_G0271606 n=1 Tax=Copidosoma floridanum TaxID=29053 RepID=UPI0006C9DDD8|nr:putative uncharacterized protein DDB_G0271606 [Copidosoma floridanum]